MHIVHDFSWKVGCMPIADTRTHVSNRLNYGMENMTNRASSCACMCVLFYFSFFFPSVFSSRLRHAAAPRVGERERANSHCSLSLSLALSLGFSTLRLDFFSSTRLRSMYGFVYVYASLNLFFHVGLAQNRYGKRVWRKKKWRKKNDESTCRYDSFCKIDSAIRRNTHRLLSFVFVTTTHEWEKVYQVYLSRKHTITPKAHMHKHTHEAKHTHTHTCSSHAPLFSRYVLLA